MNRVTQFVLAAALLTATYCCIRVPMIAEWDRYDTPALKRNAGYDWIWSRTNSYNSKEFVRLDQSRIALRLLAVSFAAAAGVVLTHRKPH